MRTERHPIRRFTAFVSRVYDRSAEDSLFFLASGVTFSVVLAAIPFFVLLISLPTLVMGNEIARFQEEVLAWLWRILPLETPEVRDQLRDQLQAAVDSAGSIGIISAILFVWFSTRLFGSLRTALCVVFDIEDTHGVIRGKLLDVQLVLISTFLLMLNIALTLYLQLQGAAWLDNLAIPQNVLQNLTATLTAFATVFVMFLLIYKFVPAGRLKWRTATVAALFAAFAFELLKSAFSWYLANFASYSSVYSSIFSTLATVVVLVVSVYYAAVLFLIGGEVAQAYEINRIVRRQRAIFD